MVGFNPALQSSRAECEKYTKLPFDGIDFETLWIHIYTAAIRFRTAYPDCDLTNAVQNVESRIACLKALVGYRSPPNP